MGQFATKLSPEDEKVKEDILKKLRVRIQLRLEDLKNGSDVDNQKLRIFNEEISQAVVDMNGALGTGLQLRPPKDLDFKLKNYKGDINDLARQMIGGTEFVGKGGVMKTAGLLLGVPLGGSLAKKGLFPHLVSDNVLVPLITSATFLALAACRKI